MVSILSKKIKGRKVPTCIPAAADSASYLFNINKK